MGDTDSSPYFNGGSSTSSSSGSAPYSSRNGTGRTLAGSRDPLLNTTSSSDASSILRTSSNTTLQIISEAARSVSRLALQTRSSTSTLSQNSNSSNGSLTSDWKWATSELSSQSRSTTTPFPGYEYIGNYNFGEDNPYILGNLGNYSACDWNDTRGCISNTTNTTTETDIAQEGYRYFLFVLVIFPFFTVFGNVLVCMSVYRERTLRTVTNYFIVSLAVADIVVAIAVMPLAVYVEVNFGSWELGTTLCDAWVATDVMGCTASILNLTAISVDRFIAVTQPIRYAKHKNSSRFYVMLALTWVISMGISAPIALGMNNTDNRIPNVCAFWNSDFIIYSSMGSFYIPCIIMLILYWRIFKAIRERAKKTAMHKKMKPLDNRNLRNVIENTAQTAKASDSTTDSGQRELLPHPSPKRVQLITTPIIEETTFTNLNTVNTTDTGEEDSVTPGAEVIKSPLSDDADHVIPNDKSAECMLSPMSEDSHCDYQDRDSGYSAPINVEVEHQYHVTSPGSHRNFLSPPGKKLAAFKNHLAGKNKRLNVDSESPRKSVTKFNFHLRHSKKKKEKLSSRRERKATKTLAIVLGVFLLCWMPFFTANNIRAICMRYNLNHRSECHIDESAFAVFVWLGYINSFLNPVIYTIFNIEFRKAFKRILMEACSFGKR